MQLTNDDREHLKQLLTHPGYKVLQIIAESYVTTLQEVATYTSQIDPLANRDKIATQWAAVAASRGFRTALEAGINFEIAMLNPHPVQPAADAERQKIWDVLGMLDPMPEDFHQGIRGDR